MSVMAVDGQSLPRNRKRFTEGDFDLARGDFDVDAGAFGWVWCTVMGAVIGVMRTFACSPSELFLRY